MQIFFKDGSHTDKITIEYPIGHRRRRNDGIPLLIAKFKANLLTRFTKKQSERILNVCLDQQTLEKTSVLKFMTMLVG
jgi:2-methylcitrate dehydratase